MNECAIDDSFIDSYRYWYQVHACNQFIWCLFVLISKSCRTDFFIWNQGINNKATTGRNSLLLFSWEQWRGVRHRVVEHSTFDAFTVICDAVCLKISPPRWPHCELSTHNLPSEGWKKYSNWPFSNFYHIFNKLKATLNTTKVLTNFVKHEKMFIQ